jgi:hypothetical protein
MFSTKQLSEKQIATISEWAAQGAQLADIQLRMRQEMEIPITYMDTRFVVLDLGITLIEEKTEEPLPEIEHSPPTPTGKTTVTMDSLAIPGSVVSGKVVFSDGESGLWKLDQTGRPSLDPNKPDYQPSREDIMEFQQQLRALIESTGL